MIHMTSPTTQNPTIPLHDYGPAVQNAVSWLGERYLLAEPMQRRNVERPNYFVEQPRWHEARRPTLRGRLRVIS
jgi:hypothetical protein